MYIYESLALYQLTASHTVQSGYKVCLTNISYIQPIIPYSHYKYDVYLSIHNTDTYKLQGLFDK